MLTDFLIFVAPFIIMILALVLAFIASFKDDHVSKNKKV
ncbi:cytochrome bd oxidase small subunit CydS [Paucisalibacillus globulus]